jgi:hypothetical protein
MAVIGRKRRLGGDTHTNERTKSKPLSEIIADPRQAAAARKLVPDEELEDTHPRVDVVDVQICALERNLLVHTLSWSCSPW